MHEYRYRKGTGHVDSQLLVHDPLADLPPQYFSSMVVDNGKRHTIMKSFLSLKLLNSFYSAPTAIALAVLVETSLHLLCHRVGARFLFGNDGVVFHSPSRI